MAPNAERNVERIAVLPEENGSMEVQHVVSSTQEALLDHAMAARIQRSFRATSTRNLDVKRKIGIMLR
jgi:hypothetical protein